ncbi:uncharacterized protein IL334_005247 [Kwoniella shivajii]|uniref:TLC domain-containing protein n=1 Tax=Kwoniella shivajii TaxID=564305 RepID=A0ABZ1D5L7_9TREE|nr:hypothetical protein IL334_005247 [Kwoniella shivajii]
MSSPRKLNRTRSSSVTNALKQIPLNQQQEQNYNTIQESEVKPLSGKSRPLNRKKPRHENDLPDNYISRGFKNDLKTGRWMLIPSSSLIIFSIPIILYFNHNLLVQYGLLKPNTTNPFKYLLFPQGKVPGGGYTKSWYDFVFVANYVVFWSFVRQFVTIHILRPMAIALGIKGGKIMRFLEQGYAVFYFSILGTLGIIVMRGLPTWWYKTEYFWLGYPHKQMTWELKTYYLIQAAYWVQQTILLAAKIEKPRKDFKELVAHHIVTLWLIGWSYNVYLTFIGVSVFVTMDVSDVFLALAKCVNYVSEWASPPFFAFFVGVWTYFRHYLNIWILWSVWAEWDLMPEDQRSRFAPLEDQWLVWWMRWQVFVPIFFLQLINLFWYFLIWRILIKAVVGQDLKDDRSDDEDDGEGEQTTTEKLKDQ